jgi:hypothetical protein
MARLRPSWDALPCPGTGATARSVEREFNYAERAGILRSGPGIALLGLTASAAGGELEVTQDLRGYLLVERAHGGQHPGGPFHPGAPAGMKHARA